MEGTLMDHQFRQRRSWEGSNQSVSPYESQSKLRRFGSGQQTDCTISTVRHLDRDATRACKTLRELSQLSDSSHASPRRSSGRQMAGQKILYVCFDCSRLVINELALLEGGCDVT